MTEKEMMQRNIEEFERLQDYMVSCDKDSETYKKMKRRYIALKVILTSSGINLTEIDYIKEQNQVVGKEPSSGKVYFRRVMVRAVKTAGV